VPLGFPRLCPSSRAARDGTELGSVRPGGDGEAGQARSSRFESATEMQFLPSSRPGWSEMSLRHAPLPRRKQQAGRHRIGGQKRCANGAGAASSRRSTRGRGKKAGSTRFPPRGARRSRRARAGMPPRRARETCRAAAGSADGEGPHRPRAAGSGAREPRTPPPRQRGGEGACARQVRPEMRRRSEEEIVQSAFSSRPVYPRAADPRRKNERLSPLGHCACRAGRAGGVGARLLAEALLLAAL
jgi:hypothetical protein